MSQRLSLPCRLVKDDPSATVQVHPNQMGLWRKGEGHTRDCSDGPPGENACPSLGSSRPKLRGALVRSVLSSGRGSSQNFIPDVRGSILYTALLGTVGWANLG